MIGPAVSAPPYPVRIPLPGRRPPQIPAYLAVHDSLRRLLSNSAQLERTFLSQLRSFPLRHSFFEGGHRPFPGGPVLLEFRSGERVDSPTPSQLGLLLFSVYVAEKLLPTEEIVPNVREIGRIASEVAGKMLSHYSASELESAVLGGVPSPKETILYLLTRRLRPRLVIETGVAQGVSSTFLLEALSRNGGGRLTSIDLPNYDPRGRNYTSEATHDGTYVKRELGVGWLVPAPLRSAWTLVLGSSREILPTLSAQDLDLFYHDSEHSYANMEFEYGWAESHLAPGGILASDDIGWNHAFRDFASHHHRTLRVLSDRRFGIAVRAGDRPSAGRTS
jgi:predicted O-methyltransferase YrrM